MGHYEYIKRNSGLLKILNILLLLLIHDMATTISPLSILPLYIISSLGYHGPFRGRETNSFHLQIKCSGIEENSKYSVQNRKSLDNETEMVLLLVSFALSLCTRDLLGLCPTANKIGWEFFYLGVVLPLQLFIRIIWMRVRNELLRTLLRERERERETKGSL